MLLFNILNTFNSILNTLNSHYKKHFSNLNIVEKVPANYEARAQVRTSTAKKFPIARRIEKDADVFVVGAFGSRGFTYGPIIGDHISAEMCQKMSPLPSSISRYL